MHTDYVIGKFYCFEKQCNIIKTSLNMVITVPADALAFKGAMSSAGLKPIFCVVYSEEMISIGYG